MTVRMTLQRSRVWTALILIILAAKVKRKDLPHQGAKIALQKEKTIRAKNRPKILTMRTNIGIIHLAKRNQKGEINIERVMKSLHIIDAAPLQNQNPNTGADHGTLTRPESRLTLSLVVLGGGHIQDQGGDRGQGHEIKVWKKTGRVTKGQAAERGEAQRKGRVGTGLMTCQKLAPGEREELQRPRLSLGIIQMVKVFGGGVH